jgi:hypothetical protein
VPHRIGALASFLPSRLCSIIAASDKRLFFLEITEFAQP